MFPKKIMHKYLMFTVTIKWINFNDIGMLKTLSFILAK